MKHLKSILWLLGSTLIMCSVVYPLALWLIGQTLFHSRANGSFIMGADGKPVGSRLIAQSFASDEYFQPRPSAVGYNGAAAGGSNWGANNPKLRGRVAQQLGLIARYVTASGRGTGALVGDDVEKWFQAENDPKKGEKRRDLTAAWASQNPTLLSAWATSSDTIKDFVKDWAKEHAGVLGAWKKKNPDAKEADADALAPFLFDPAIADSFVKLHPGMWPCSIEEQKDGKAVKLVKAMNEGDDIRSIFFDMWLHEHPHTKLEQVPADMVMASGAGLDPHITLQNARYQLPRVAKKWVEKTGAREVEVRRALEDVLSKHTEASLGGLAGVPLVNVLEVNLALRDRMNQFGPKGS